MANFQQAKAVVQNYIQEFDQAADKDLKKVLKKYVTKDYHWRGMHPFYEQFGAKAVVKSFWRPLRQSFTPLQRRPHIFFAGNNDCDGGETQWVVNAGNFLGLFDQPWLDIPPTGRLTLIRYAEFHRVTPKGKIAETAFFCDVIDIMHQAGQYPLPPMTGKAFPFLPPRTQDGLLYDEQPPADAQATMDLVNLMIDDLDRLNKSGSYGCPPEVLARTWRDDMIWYGPSGIGTSYTIPRYQEQHQLPFRANLTDKTYNGHIARFAEGNYCGFFGWPNLNNKNKGGFMGLPASEVHAPMRIVDMYRREGDKLAENWVYMDVLHYLYEQGLDVLKRMRELNRNAVR
ncbi:MAG: nuclear transport factor 2 family protein [Bacteroidota bacterium]